MPVFLKALLASALKYIQAHPELAPKIFEMLIGYIFPEEATFSAGEDTPEPLKTFAAEADAIVAQST